MKDKQGNPPQYLKGYAAGVAWKYALQAQRQVQLVEMQLSWSTNAKALRSARFAKNSLPDASGGAGRASGFAGCGFGA